MSRKPFLFARLLSPLLILSFAFPESALALRPMIEREMESQIAAGLEEGGLLDFDPEDVDHLSAVEDEWIRDYRLHGPGLRSALGRIPDEKVREALEECIKKFLITLDRKGKDFLQPLAHGFPLAIAYLLEAHSEDEFAPAIERFSAVMDWLPSWTEQGLEPAFLLSAGVRVADRSPSLEDFVKNLETVGRFAFLLESQERVWEKILEVYLKGQKRGRALASEQLSRDLDRLAQHPSRTEDWAELRNTLDNPVTREQLIHRGYVEREPVGPWRILIAKIRQGTPPSKLFIQWLLHAPANLPPSLPVVWLKPEVTLGEVNRQCRDYPPGEGDVFIWDADQVDEVTARAWTPQGRAALRVTQASSAQISFKRLSSLAELALRMNVVLKITSMSVFEENKDTVYLVIRSA